MNRIGELWRRLAFLFRRRQVEEDLAEEMRLHLELRAAAEAARLGPEADAESAARRRFGNLTYLRETSREAWGWGWLDSMVQDLRYGARTLAAHPAFTFTAAFSLALGIGANTAIFSIVNAVMLRALPVEDPHRLVQVSSPRNDVFTNPLWEQIRDHQQAFAGTLAWGTDRFDLAEGGEKHLVSGLWVSGEFFPVLGVPALRGRVFTREDDRHGGGASGPVAVISYSFWRSHFGGDASVLGKTIKLNRHPFEIVGVTPPWFTGLDVDSGYDIAIPIGCEPILHTDQSALDQRSWWWLRVLARLAPGTSLQQAQARLQSIAPEIRRATLPPNWDARDQQEYLHSTFELRPAATGFSNTGAQYGKALLTLMAVVALVLLIACANIANLLLARAAARQREISIRMAIGAGRRRVIRQLLTESLLLALLGALGGLLFAHWGSGVLVRLLSTSQQQLDLDVSADLRVLAFTAAVAVLTGILFGLAPAFRATGVSPNQFLKENARGSVAGASRFRLGKALVAGQVALSLVLLVAAGLFLGTMRRLLTVQVGFNPHDVLLVHVDTLGRVPKERRTDLYRLILERLRALPRVPAAAGSVMTPISNQIWNNWTYPEGYHAKSREDTLTYFNSVSPGYFATVGTPLLAGRDFDTRDRKGSPKVMIIGESAARQFFPIGSPLGKTISLDVMDKPGARERYEVIGVAGDVKYEKLREDTLRTAYLPLAQDPDPWPEATFELRFAGPLDALTASVRAAIAGIDRGLSLDFKSLETQVSDSLLQERTVALLSTFFGGLALLLAVIGLYGVTSYAVARRQGEIGIRMALGASRNSLVGLVMRDVVLLVALGAVLGTAGSLAAGRLIASLLYGVKPADPVTLAAAVLVLAGATAMAGYLPARRAARLDPTAALREE